MTSYDDFITDDVTLPGKDRCQPFSQMKLVGNLRRNVFEADRRAGDALEPDAVEREPWQLADLHLPLHQRVGARVAVHAQQQEPLALLVVAVVGVEHATDLPHHVRRLHRARRLHTPREPQRARFGGSLVGRDGRAAVARATAGHAAAAAG